MGDIAAETSSEAHFLCMKCLMLRGEQQKPSAFSLKYIAVVSQILFRNYSGNFLQSKTLWQVLRGGSFDLCSVGYVPMAGNYCFSIKCNIILKHRILFLFVVVVKFRCVLHSQTFGSFCLSKCITGCPCRILD